jgi:cell division protein ZapA
MNQSPAAPEIDPPAQSTVRSTDHPVATPSAATPAASESVAVDIYDQIYHLRGPNPAYIEQLAGIVDSKMRAVSAHGGTVDSLRVAVLAALNIADELASVRARHDALATSLRQSQNSVRTRAGSLAGLLDEVLLKDVDDPVASRRAG